MGIIKNVVARIKARRADKNETGNLSLPDNINDALSELSLQLVGILVERVVEKRNPSPAVVEALADAFEAAAKELRESLEVKDA